MTRAPYPQADPRRKRIRKGLERIDELVKKYVAEGMSEEEARERATKEQRDNTRGDWRAG